MRISGPRRSLVLGGAGIFKAGALNGLLHGMVVIDAFDAMTSTRAYQPALPVDFAVQEIRENAGTQFDPNVVDIFLELAAVDRLPLELSA